MKLTIDENRKISEEEVIIRCPKMNGRLSKLVAYVRQYTTIIQGEAEGKNCQVPLEEILYMESVDGKVFFYDSRQVYLVRNSLKILEEKLKETPFVRISKSCLMNLEYLKYVEPYTNHRLRAELKNGEKLLVSRNYIPELKKKLKGQEGFL